MIVLDYWGSVEYSSTRSGSTFVLAMCWGISNLVYLHANTQQMTNTILTCLCFVFNQAANDCDLEPVAYEFFTQAYILYEEEISVSQWVIWELSFFLARNFLLVYKGTSTCFL